MSDETILLKISDYIESKTKESFETPFNSLFKRALIGVDYNNQIFVYELESCAAILAQKLIGVENQLNDDTAFTSDDINEILKIWSQSGKYKRALIAWSESDEDMTETVSNLFSSIFNQNNDPPDFVKVDL